MYDWFVLKGVNKKPEVFIKIPSVESSLGFQLKWNISKNEALPEQSGENSQ